MKRLTILIAITFNFDRDDCELQFGDSQKLRLVRILRSTVMVRVGGGWVALDEFLLKNDPCRGKYSPQVFNLRYIYRRSEIRLR